jgi:hypothetical protein
MTSRTVQQMIRLATCAGAMAVLPTLGGDVLINEFMAYNVTNATALRDEDGDASDWIELLNVSTNPVQLAGWHLTDDAGDLEKWTFPSNTLPPGGFLIVFASGKNRAAAGEELHANFLLAGTGSYLGLTRPNGSTVEFAYAPAYPLQVAGVSYGVGTGSSTATLLQAGAPCRVTVPTDNSLGLAWIECDGFDDQGWTQGVTGVGYDTRDNYLPDIGTDIMSPMFSNTPSAYIRIPFVVGNPSQYERLTLKVKYDDGFIAYINGQEIASANAPAVPLWNSAATELHDGLEYETFTLPDAGDVLESGTNVLAIHGLNRTSASGDFLILPGLQASEQPTPVNGLLHYFQTPTPGSANGVGTSDMGPAISDVAHVPPMPADDEDLTVRARIVSPTGTVTAATLRYIVMFTNETSIPLLDDGAHGDGTAGDGIYGATVPSGSYTAGQMVRYYLTAVDGQAHTSRWPLAEDPAPCLGTVVANPALTNSLPSLHWFVRNPGWHTNFPSGNNANWTNAWLFWEGRFYDGVEVQVRGGSSAGWPKPSFKFEMSKGHYFNYATNREPVEEWNLQSTHSDKSYVRQILAHETYRNSGVPYEDCFPLRVEQNSRFYSVAVFVEQPDERYLRRHGLDVRGALYKMYNGVTSDASGVSKRTRTEENTDDLKALVSGVNPTNTTAARARYVFDNVDVPALINYIAATTIMHDNDHVMKNYFLYRDSEGSRNWMMIPWDKDLTFGRNFYAPSGWVLNDTIWATNDVIDATKLYLSPSHPRYGDSDHQKSDALWNRLIDALHDAPVLRQMYMRRLRTLMDELLQPPGTPRTELRYEERIQALHTAMSADVLLDRAKWGNPYGVNQDFAKGVAVLTNDYLVPRRQHLFITHSVTHGNEIPLAQTQTLSIAIGALETTPLNGNQDQEYIELVNRQSTAVDLSGCILTGAVDFTFSPGTVIAASSNVFVSPAVAEFRKRINSPRSNEGRLVVGDYAGHLSARGERIELHAPDGGLLATLSYTGTPSRCQTDLRVTEILYHPRDGAPFEDSDYAFVELQNTGALPLNLNGVRFTQGIEYTFMDVELAPAQFVVVVRNQAAFSSRYDTNGILVAGEFTGSLSEGGETLKLEDPLNETILDFGYDATWHPATDSDGYALVIMDAHAAYDSWGLAASWRPGVLRDGTPGRAEPTLPEGSIIISELLAGTTNRQDWIEICNAMPYPMDVGGWLLSDSAQQLARYVIPTGTTLASHSCLVFTEDDFNNSGNASARVPFGLNPMGGSLYLSSGSNGIAGDYRDSISYGPSEIGVSFGRYVNSQTQSVVTAMATTTPGASNGPPRVGPVVISELMYHPFSGGHEFIELRNIASNSVALFSAAQPTNTWRLNKGVDFAFPTNQFLSAGGYTLVVPIDPYTFRTLYGVPGKVAIFGPYAGALDNGGEKVHLAKPGSPTTNGLLPWVLVDGVDYNDDAPWPLGPDGSGPALERVNETAFADDPANWRTANRGGSPGTLTQLDLDHDGLPDSWEQQVFGTVTHIKGGPQDDPDGDGSDNLSEYTLGTHPTGATSCLRLTLLDVPAPDLVIQFPATAASGPGYYGLRRHYALERSPALMDPTWAGPAGFTNIEGNGMITYTNTTLATGSCFRVRGWLE